VVLERVLRAGGVLLLLLGLIVPACAEAPRKAEPRTTRLGWDGKPITHTCHADLTDLQGLKAALVEHEKVRIGFKNKIRHGVFSGGELSGGRIRNALPTSLVEMIARHLADPSAGEALALVYDMGIVGGQYALCVWLFSANGIEAAATVPIGDHSPFRSTSAATTVRSGLDVEGRAVARAPQTRLGQEAEAPAQMRERASEQLVEEAWSLLMPSTIALKLRHSSAKRLLVLPVSDIGFVPFAALPLGGEQLIDRFALVLLPDVEALLDLSWDAQAGSQREMRGVVVGDPDLSWDPRWKFPPLPGARNEAEEVAALVGAHPLLGEEATKSRVLAELKASRNASLIYLATHALSDAVNPMDGSFLALAGDHLYGRDIKSLLFPSNPVVVMSACQTGLGKVFEGGTFGLVRAWYHVGAPQIVMSLWNIDDNATKDLMLEFMRRLKSGALTEFALREAMLATRQKYADPALWASVALFGLPSRTSRLREPTSLSIALPTEPATSTPRSMATVPSGAPQRVVLYEEDPHEPAGRKSTGSVVWGIALAPGAQRQDAELRGEITVPERQLSLAWSLRRNNDPALPASHLLELTFVRSGEVDGIHNVPGMLVKASEEAPGKPLEALAVKIAGTTFLLGLSITGVQSNETLLKEGRWFDIPIVHESGNRAVLALEKGSAGERAFGEVFSAWSAPGLTSHALAGVRPPAIGPPAGEAPKHRSAKKAAPVDWRMQIWRQ
jgi:CHAT domain-containing protein